MNRYISAALLIAIVSCGPAPKLKKQRLTNLDSLTVAEVYKIKYEDKVFLNCEVKLKISEIPEIKKESFSANLVEEPNCSRTINLTVNDRKIEMKVYVKSFSVFQKINITDHNNVAYEMKHTPVAEVTIEWTDSNQLGLGATEVTDRTLFENVPALPLQEIGNASDKTIRCSMSATPVKAYQHEWKIVEAPAQ